MLDLGFLEDVEKILSLTPGSRQTALFSATMPPEIRELAERYLYDPVTVKVKAATLTIDTVEQFYARDQAGRRRPTRSCACSRPSGPTQAIVFVRTKIRCDQLYRTLRDNGMNVKALHGDMTPGLARRRDDLASRAGACRSSSPPTSPPAGSTSRRSRTSSTSTCRRRPTSTCTASAAPAASGARAARSRSSSRASSASSRRSSATPTRRSRRGRRARTSRRRTRARARRAATRKPHDAPRRNGDGLHAS